MYWWNRASNTTRMHIELNKSSQDCQPNEVHAFNFPLSNAGKDNPQGSFDCVQQTSSTYGALQFKLRAQAEKASQNQGAEVTDGPDGPFSGLQLNTRKAESREQPAWKERKTEIRRVPQSTPDPVPERKRTTPMNPANIFQRISSGVSDQPFKDRVIHLLALKNYKKPELLNHLQRDGVMQKDKDSLEMILQQVANLNAKDNSFSLKEHLFKDIQKDWPGYTEVDREVLEIRLSRKSAFSQNATSTSHLTPWGPSDTDAPSRTSEKWPLDSNFTFPVVSKKQRIGRLASRVQPTTGGLSPASSTLPPTDHPTSNTSETVSSVFLCISGVQQKDMPQTPFGIPAPALMQGESLKPRENKEDRKRLKTSQLLDFTEGVKETCTASTDIASSREQPDDSICGALQLNDPDSVQDKVTVGGTSNNDEMTRERLTQAEKETCSQNTKVIRPHGRLLGRKAEVRRVPQSTSDAMPERKRTTPMNPENVHCSRCNTVYRRPFRERVIHLLALRNYKKPELLNHLQRDGIMQKDRGTLGKILQQVANLNAKDNSFSLKEHLFKDIQKDWPGYTEVDREVLEIRLSRKSAFSQNATSTSHLTPWGPSDTDAPSRTSEKRPLDSNFTFPVVSKKQRIGRLASRVQPAAGGLSPASSTLPPTDHPTSNTSETVSSIFLCTSEVQQKDMPQTPFETPVHGVEETFTVSADPVSSREQPDYFIKYTAIASYEQRQSYKDDFNAEYGEYQNLLAQTDNIAKKFGKFNEQQKFVTQGSTEYQMLCCQVLTEHKKIQQFSPIYSELKKKCQYLHSKLSHIKRLIQEFDKQQEESCNQSSALARTHL
ncbi:RNA polymerase II elongation factor ELL2-like isoform X1 [Manacus candei]|uniref:RNA polymerase II elongation factor ELL2-like isoform X1 n=2 Tax=Manacus candei TaxID=415023 RepID=UPI002226761F|nr:RNA polymerase II elongation factor ELL2-like isoform X1 [Manacus candei]XP_051638479.1 RNA polymerase II elongation factor ELL2-like isoform X1 [Manacus candei]XP_051638480.1 RNA polymerase II elongation factor ELL2-like isoform X1 [Manacus candei]XP_051638481.1 RNA polymerase II elongation factor ELL2-like isoform X1 [Manacus candei]XP_051638482.1 RNA polymerase II elongation factor ELL2-like isoform X1 [Manacus candei]